MRTSACHWHVFGYYQYFMFYSLLSIVSIPAFLQTISYSYLTTHSVACMHCML